MMHGWWDGSAALWYGMIFGPLMMIAFIVVTVVIIAWVLHALGLSWLFSWSLGKLRARPALLWWWQTRPDDPRIHVALEIASALRERLIVVARSGVIRCEGSASCFLSRISGWRDRSLYPLARGARGIGRALGLVPALMLCAIDGGADGELPAIVTEGRAIGAN